MIPETPIDHQQNKHRQSEHQQSEPCYLHDSTPGGIIQLTKEVIAIIRSQNTKGQPLQAKQSALEKLDDIVLLDWTKAFPGVEKYRSKYGIVVHMVSKLDINPSDIETYKDQVEQLENENKRSSLHIAQIVPLRCRPRQNQTSIYHSIV